VADFQHVSDLTAQQPSPDVQFQLAQAYLLNGDRNKAIAILNHALEIKTNYIPGRLLLSKLEIRQGEAASAIALLTETLKFPQLPDPIVAEANLILANAYLAQKAPGPAAAIYQRMEVTFPKNAQMPYLAGRAMVRNSQPEPARVEFEKSLALDPEFTPSLQELVDLDLAKANYSAAMARVQAEINKHPTNAMPLLLKARVCMAAKDVPQAEAALQKVLSLDPNLPAAYLMLARLYVDNHQEKEALQKLTTLVGMTNDITALMEIGQIHELDKEYDPARNSYETLLNLSPKFGGALNNLAYLFSEHYKDQSKAYDLAEKAHEIAPFDAYVDDTLGWILFKRGEYPRALALEEESAAKHPSDPDVQYHMGMCHYMLGEEELARLAFQNSASKSDYENREEVLHRLAIIAVDPKTATPADRTLLEKEIEKEPSDPVATMRLAALQERDGELDKAAATYEGAIQKNPKDVRAAARLGQLYATKLNKPEKGMELAKNAHQQAPDDPFVSAILGRLVFQARDYPYALSLLQAAARGMAGQPDLMHDLAWAYFSTGNIPKAQTSMEAALQTGIAFAKIEDAKQFLAMLAVCGNPAQTQAAAKVQQAVQADANYAPALMAQGLVEEQQGHPKVAEQSYEKLLTLYPLFAPANRQLAILYARDGDDPKAFACAEKARSTFPDDAELGKYAGLAAYHLKNFSVSSQYLTQSTAKLRDDGEALYYLGMDYFQLKDNANSKKTLQQAVKSKLPGDLAAEANKVLAQLK
jgi:tetratricopeptide (TPR) repeat protein